MSITRENWTSRTSFILAAVGSAIGLGNVWRFPYICYENGGGAFLIPYFFALFTCGIPLLMVEFIMGKRARGGAPQAFEAIRPFMSWAGWLACLCAFIIVTYYCSIMAWSWDYIWYSMKLAWGNDAAGFFNQQVLNKTAGPGMLGGIQMPILIGLILTWLAILLILWKGIGSVGKVVLVTVPLPVMCLVILAIRGLTLPGAVDGVIYYLQPDFSKLQDPRVWLAAYGQILFSLSLGQAVLIAYASYLPKDADISNNSFMTGFINCGFSFFAGFAVFSALGFLAYQVGVPVQDVVKSGPDLAFITYPTIISKLPFWAPFFGVVFFLMLLTLGIDSAFALVEGFATPLKDATGIKHTKVIIWLCIIGLAIGILYVTRGGFHWLDIVDKYVSDFGLVTIALAECIVVGWIFGARKFRKEINDTSEVKIGGWWDICIMFITPLILGYILIHSLIKGIVEPYGGYPAWANWVGGWGMIVAAILVSIFLGMKFNRKENK
ncbi:MAG: sodium-dependent transporter [Candidatus Hatepunaea meridiana]|nr:sodium-dependent transporter [Candidatus Hatepunaea meridiana]